MMDTLRLIRTLRINNNGLINKYPNIEQCIQSLIGIQSQYFNHAALVIRSRVEKEISIEDLFSLLNNNRIIDIWGQRSTLHFYHIDDWEKIISSFGKTKCWVKKFCERNSFDYEEELKRLGELFDEYGDLTTEQMIEMGTKPILIKNWGGLLIPLSLQGNICIKRFNSFEPKHYISRNLIINKPFKREKEHLKALLFRYFSTYGPATCSDFLHWSGLHMDEVKNELDSLSGSLNTLIFNKNVYYYGRKSEYDECKNNIVNLLPKFDPLLVAYKNKSVLINEEYHSLVWKKAGQIDACIFVDGEFVGTWRYLINAKNIDFYITICRILTSALRQAIFEKCLEYSRYMNKNINKIIFE